MDIPTPEIGDGKGPAPTVAETTYNRIRADILSGDLKPGVKLKLERLRDRYEVSINTLRETLSRLTADGFVLAGGQRGFQVVPVSIKDLQEILDLRVLLECQGTRLSLENGDLNWEGRVVAANHKLVTTERLMLEDEKTHAGDWEAWDREFHVALVSACGSNQLIRFHQTIYDLFHRYQLLALSQRPFRREQSSEEHRQILEHVLDRNVEAAVDLLSTHIRRGIGLANASA